MSDPVVLHRLQFAFTIIYHYLFPVLTMGLAFLIVVMKALGLREGGERWNDAARKGVPRREDGEELRLQHSHEAGSSRRAEVAAMMAKRRRGNDL